MSQRTISGFEITPSVREIQENLLNFEFNLKNEFEILSACLKLCSQNTLLNIENDIQVLKLQINEEIESYKDFNSQLQRRKSGITPLDVEEYNIIKLKYNKLVLQIEKIYSSNSELESITNKFPRGKLKIESQILIGNAQSQMIKANNEETVPKNSNVLSRILPKPPLSSNSLISNNSSIIQSLNPQNKNAAQDLIKNIAKRETVDENNKEFIKRELIQLKQLIQEVNKKIDTHEHTDYEMELDRLRKENNQILHDYKILKNDNTELMHSVRTLQKMACEIKIQNERLLLGIQNPAAFKYYNNSPISNIPSSNDQRVQEFQLNQQQMQQPPSRLSAMSYQNANKDMVQSPNNTKMQNEYSKRNTLHDGKSQNNNLQSPQNINSSVDKNSRVLTRNSSHNQTNMNTQANNNNKCMTEANQRSSYQRSLIPSQQSNREENVDYDLLSSWARKRIMEQ
ncbi:hypothetical protein TTHERM_00145820 (macronuclear) [Tetrahymena thermophila SB210]|uniref:Uncharacterized protein n=1 Tax=Tetrahymena thermophila (strain SB210) TaxID=312017 RepID=I7MDU6_TETTS|nr:hypothetical protein TTHERM_00145820 [Tetrahymena thermophila SB210]EAR90977.1 hypothetical protein TTHERM_00145820 [Tetrahymena thermophila SB210]|eukprot:XP_001011222.1 hypothetical protein TTHERM_00145820 [Tetrahymena thermophila SB210]